METVYIDGTMFKKSLKAGAKFLEKNKEEINALNVFPVPDGDTGTNMSLTMQSAVKQGISVEGNNISEIALAASQGSLMGARGNSGVILSQLFRGFALGMDGKDKIDIETLANCFKQASDTAYKAVMKPTEGTILTVARECGEYAQRIARKEKDIIVFAGKVLNHGNLILSETPNMLPVLKEAGVVDAGGKGLIAVLTGAYNALSGLEEEEEESIEEQETRYKEIVEHKHLDPEDIKFGYCTEFMVNGEISDLEVNRFRSVLSTKGDSLMVVQGEGIVKVHVHTNNPGQALEEAVQLGALSDIKIDNMRFQHEKVIERDKELKDSKKEPSKKYSFVAVSTGDGINEVFKGLNVDVIVEGGQTMNPSTEDIARAIEKTDGENIFILPNNGNIILAAEQSKELSDRNVIVIPTKTIPQGFAAMFEFMESDSPEENKKNMLAGIEDVRTGQVTYSVRDTEINGNKIEKDDIIGLLEGDIVSNSKKIENTIDDLLDSMIEEDSSLLTIIYGEDVDEEDAEKIEEKLSEKYDDMDIELVYGGQPIYYYIFSVE